MVMRVANKILLICLVMGLSLTQASTEKKDPGQLKLEKMKKLRD